MDCGVAALLLTGRFDDDDVRECATLFVPPVHDAADQSETESRSGCHTSPEHRVGPHRGLHFRHLRLRTTANSEAAVADVLPKIMNFRHGARLQMVELPADPGALRPGHARPTLTKHFHLTSRLHFRPPEPFQIARKVPVKRCSFKKIDLPSRAPRPARGERVAEGRVRGAPGSYGRERDGDDPSSACGTFSQI